MTTLDLEAARKHLCQAVLAAGEFARAQRQLDPLVNYKQDGSRVTRVDLQSEHLIRDEMRRKGYDFWFHGEECVEEPRSEDQHQLVADGIDGTKNFCDGNYGWCVTAMLRSPADDLCSAVYDPVAEQLYSAIRNGGAYLAAPRGPEKTLQVPETLQADFSFGVGSFFVRGSRQLRQALSDSIKDLGGRERSWGSVGLSICAVARGGWGVYIQGNSHYHDYAAAVLIAAEAGAGVLIASAIDPARADVVVSHPMLSQSVARCYELAVHSPVSPST